jgi:hypothetical protein
MGASALADGRLSARAHEVAERVCARHAELGIADRAAGAGGDDETAVEGGQRRPVRTVDEPQPLPQPPRFCVGETNPLLHQLSCATWRAEVQVAAAQAAVAELSAALAGGNVDAAAQAQLQVTIADLAQVAEGDSAALIDSTVQRGRALATHLEGLRAGA